MILRRALSTAALAVGLFGASAIADAPSVLAAPGQSSLGVLFGVGWYDNTDFNRDLELNGIPPIENGFEYGLQFRKRVSRWFSIGAELGRMDGRTNPTDGSNTEYAIDGTPLLFDVFVHPVTVGNASLSLFGGIGPVIATRLSASFPDGGLAEGKKLGLSMQAGVEGEGRFGPNFGFFVRTLMRRADAKDIAVDDGSGAEPPRYDVDFDGMSVAFGPRWYFGGSPAPGMSR